MSSIFELKRSSFRKPIYSRSVLDTAGKSHVFDTFYKMGNIIVFFDDKAIYNCLVTSFKSLNKNLTIRINDVLKAQGVELSEDINL